jgi:hypothetical protein
MAGHMYLHTCMYSQFSWDLLYMHNVPSSMAPVWVTNKLTDQSISNRT